MLLGLSKIIDCPGASIPFSTSVDLSDLCFGVSYPVSEPVLAEGMVRNTLSRHYGDYMKLPPKEQQIPHLNVSELILIEPEL